MSSVYYIHCNTGVVCRCSV